MVLPLWSPLAALSGGIFLALLHSFLLHCQAAAAVAAAVFALLLLSAHNLALLATPPPLTWSCHAAAQLTHSYVRLIRVGFSFIMIVYQCKLLVVEPDHFLPSQRVRRQKRKRPCQRALSRSVCHCSERWSLFGGRPNRRKSRFCISTPRLQPLCHSTL